MGTGPLNPVTAGYLDSSGNAVTVDPTHPLPVTSGAESTATVPSFDPSTATALTDSQLLRAILSVLQTMQRAEQDGLDGILNELQALSAMQASAYDLYDGPDAYRPVPPPTS